MGWRYEVQAYAQIDASGYKWRTTWEGSSLIGAVRAMREAKRHVGPVRLTWR